MKWIAETTVKSITEREFALEHGGRSVPGIVWTPEGAAGPTRLMLLGHGGHGSKRAPYIVSLARQLVRHRGIAAAAIDAVGHGDRAPSGGTVLDDSTRRAMRDGAVADRMIEDWRATLDALQKLPELQVAPVGYWGLSMGTMFGVPFVAAEPRISVAVLGLMGVGVFGDRRLKEDAARVTCPVLFIQQWNDELVPRESCLELFDAIGSPDKRLHAHPGLHAAVPPEEGGFTETFLDERLG